jgi:flagellar hook-associated protein 1 FlgK
MLGLKSTLWNTVSGMNVSQAGLSTVGHNLANADTEGYSRQKLHIGNRGPLQVNTGSEQISQAGQGARVENINRAHNTFLERQLIRDRLDRGFFDGQSGALRLFERLFNDGSSNTIGTAMDDFFNSARELSQDPSNDGHRDLFLERTQNLTNSFNRIAEESRRVQEDIDRSLQAKVERINELGEVIRTANARIGSIEAVGLTANDARDHRDIAVKKIAELANVRVLIHKDGSAQINLANGFTLVQGTTLSSLRTLPDPANDGLLAVQHIGLNGIATDITDSITKGEIGGLLEARDSIIPERMGEIDNLAFTLTEQVNAIHQGGFGLDGIGARDLLVPVGAVNGAARAMGVDPGVIANPDQVAAATDILAAPGDNRNLLRLADLQMARQGGLGDISLNHFYGEVVRRVGSDVEHNQTFAEFHQARFEQSDSLRESIEGVSIDDEMVDLSRYQKHFEASARVMDTVNRLMDEILQLVR